jgi:hypothetical protein
MIYSDELLAAAKRIFWFGTPEEALEFPKRFLTYAMTPHPVFSTEAPGPNGMNVTTAPPFRLFRGDRFQVSIPPRSPISFPPSLETGNVTTPSDRRYLRWM